MAYLRGIYALSGKITLSPLFFVSLMKMSTLEEFAPNGSKFFSFRVDSVFRRGLVEKESNLVVGKEFLLVEWRKQCLVHTAP